MAAAVYSTITTKSVKSLDMPLHAKAGEATRRSSSLIVIPGIGSIKIIISAVSGGGVDSCRGRLPVEGTVTCVWEVGHRGVSLKEPVQFSAVQDRMPRPRAPLDNVHFAPLPVLPRIVQ